MDKQYPEPVVGACIMHNNKLLIMKSHKWKNLWIIPGGHVELGETILDALQREAKEETGLDVFDPKFICIWEFINEDGFHTKKHMLFMDYRVDALSDEVKLNDEGQEYKWVTKDEAIKLPLEKYTKMTIEKHSDKIFE